MALHEVHTHVNSNEKNAPLNIDIVTETYPPEVNGVARTISRLVQELIKKSHSVTVIRPAQHTDRLPDHPSKLSNDVLVRSIAIPLYNELRMGLPCKRRLIKRWTARKPDIVHVATEGPLGWSAVQAARQLNIPVTSDFRTNFHAYSRMYKIGFLEPLVFAYLRKIHNDTSCTMVPTRTLMSELGHAGINNLRVVSRGVDTGLFNPSFRSEELRASWAVQPTDTVLLSVGRLAVEKNLQLLIRTYYAAKLTKPTTKLVVVGDGPLRPQLEQDCPSAIFVGTKNGLELAQHYASADVFVFPSLSETFGNVTIEAMSSGLAVVAYQHAAAGELIETGLNGITIDPDKTINPNHEMAFIKAVTSLLMSPLQIQQLGQSAVSSLHYYSWDQIVDRVVDIFNEKISHNKKTLDCHQSVMIQT